MADIDDLRRNQHFIAEMEQAIRVANREVIDPLLPPINRDSVLPLAIAVARLRGAYLQATFKLGAVEGDAPSEADIETLARHKNSYVEAREAFEALMTAIERGYLDLSD